MISRMRNIVQHNLPAKILALVIAVILWGYVMNDQNPSIESTYTVQLDVVNAPEGYKITKDAASVNGFVEEIIAGQRDVKVFSHEKQVMQDFAPINESFYQS